MQVRAEATIFGILQKRHPGFTYPDARLRKKPQNDLDLGTIEGIPRIPTADNAMTHTSAIRIALFALADAFGCSQNDLLLTLVLSWYEQKAVQTHIADAFISRIKNIFLGSTSPGGAYFGRRLIYFVKNYNITPTDVPKRTLRKRSAENNVYKYKNPPQFRY